MKSAELLKAVISGLQWVDRPFLIEGLTFEQLYSQAQAVKTALKQAGCTQTPVCLCVENRGLMAAAMLAALTGGPPLLFPYAYAGQTLIEAQQKVPYTHALVEGRYDLPEGVTPIPMSGESNTRNHFSPSDVLAPDTTWIYLFTGGSTGSPQIWSKSPRNLLLEAANLARAFHIRPTDVILSSVPPNHIYGLLYSVLLPLLAGSSVSVRTPSFPREIIQAMDETRATVLVSIPAHYRGLKEMRFPGHRIHTAFSSAGALSEQDDRDFFNSTGIAVTEIYGSTETGGIAYRQRGAGQCALRPFSYVDVRIDDERLRVRSDFLSAELSTDAQGFFSTADRVAPADQAGFEILGRADGIVKVGGKRVDLAQIRQSILDIAGVEDAYVLTVPVNSGRENEIIAVVAGRVEANRIMRKVKMALPPYAAPRRVKVVDRMPLSAAGKYNREAIDKIISSRQ